MGLERGIAANSRSKKIKSTLTTNSTTGNSEYVIGRVVDIVLNSEHPKFQDVGGYNGIGTIYYEINNKIGNSKFTAKPFYPQFSTYPLLNELVLRF